MKKERAQGLWDIDEEVDTPGVETMEGEVEGVADVEEIIKRGYYCIQGLRCDVEISITHIPTITSGPWKCSSGWMHEGERANTISPPKGRGKCAATWSERDENIPQLTNVQVGDICGRQ